MELWGQGHLGMELAHVSQLHIGFHMVLVGVLYDTFGVAFGGFIVLREASST
jgi:hypothetical protein